MSDSVEDGAEVLHEWSCTECDAAVIAEEQPVTCPHCETAGVLVW